MGLVGLVPSCLRGYFVGPKFFPVDISYVSIFFLRLFRVPKIFSCQRFVGLKFFLVGIWWVQDLFLLGILRFQIFFLWVFREQKFFSWARNYDLWVFLLFSVVGCRRKCDTEIYLKLRILSQIDFKKCEIYLY